MGIAVASATDVTKAAARLVLTSAGLSNIVAAVELSRRIFDTIRKFTSYLLSERAIAAPPANVLQYPFLLRSAS